MPGEPTYPNLASQQEEKRDEVFEKKKEKIQRVLDERADFLRTFSGGLPLTYSAGDRFHFDSKKGEVILDTNWLEEASVSNDQLIWLVMNQVAGLREAVEDAETLKERQAFERKSGVPKELKQLRQAVDAIAHDAWIQNVAPKYRSEQMSEEIAQLIDESIIPGDDFRSLSKAQQFIKGLRKQALAPEIPFEVDEDVRDALTHPFQFSDGREISVEKFISEYLCPYGRKSELQKRYKYLKAFERRLYQLANADGGEWGQDPAENNPIDPDDLPPEYKDEYIPQSMKEGEAGKEKAPTIFRIYPGKHGYYRSVIKNQFDPLRKTWSNTRRTHSQPQERALRNDSTFSGKVNGLVSLPLPPGSVIDMQTVQTSGEVQISRDTYGHYFASSDSVSTISFEYAFGKELRVKPSQFEKKLFQAKLSSQTEALLTELAQEDPSEIVRRLLEWIHKKYAYNVEAQGQLFYGSSGVEDYFKKIDTTNELECYTSNTFFVALCRRLNIPARLEAGHYLDQTEPDGSVSIRRDTGHAWSQVYIGGQWVLTDATPPKKGGEKGDGEESDSGEDGEESENSEDADGNESDQEASGKEKQKDKPGKKSNKKKEKQETENQPDLPDPMQIDDHERNDYIEQLDQSEAEKQAEEEKARREAQEALDDKWREKHSIDENVFAEFKKYEREMQPYLDTLSRLWRRITSGKAMGLSRELGGTYRSGEALSIPEVIKQWPAIQSGDFRRAEIYHRMESQKELIKQPELIRVRLVLDASGSMFMDRSRLEAMKKSYTLLMSSLDEFNRYLEFSRNQTKSQLRIETQAITFGDDYAIVKPLTSEPNAELEWVKCIRAFSELNTDRGSTSDFNALNSIVNSISESDQQKVKEGKILDLVIELTDGGSDSATLARNAVNRLRKIGVEVAALMMGEPSDYDRDTFDDVWVNKREKALGHIVGSDLSKLPLAVSAILAEHLGDIEL